jgi:hypothetical protein
MVRNDLLPVFFDWHHTALITTGPALSRFFTGKSTRIEVTGGYISHDV